MIIALCILYYPSQQFFSHVGMGLPEQPIMSLAQGHNIVAPRGFIKRREAGIFPFYSGMFPLLLLINLYRVNRQILSNHPPTLT